MPRESYERFAALAPQVLGDGFEFHAPDSYGNKAFFDFVPHVVDLRSQLREPNDRDAFYGGILNHVLLDIFIMDDCDEGLSQAWRRARLKLVYGLSWAHRYELDYSDYSPAQRVVVWVLSHVGKLFKQTTLNRAYDNVSKSASAGKGGRCFLGNTLLEELDRSYEWAWYAPGQEMDYAGHRFMVPANHHRILTELYGDYMQLPRRTVVCPSMWNWTTPV